MSWISPRIWRSAESNFNDDEPLFATDVYTTKVLQDISRQGFDAIWMRGRLRELMRSKIYPELNAPKASERIANFKKVITDGQACGVKLVKTELGEMGTDGRRRPQVIPGSEEVLEADAIIIAVGSTQSS